MIITEATDRDVLAAHEWRNAQERLARALREPRRAAGRRKMPRRLMPAGRGGGGKAPALSDVPGLHFDWHAGNGQTVLGTQPSPPAQDITDVSWTKTRTVATAADRFREDATLGNHAIELNSGFLNLQTSAIADIMRTTIVCEIKPDGRTWVQPTGNSGSGWATFDLTGAGAVSSMGAQTDGASVLLLGDGYYRCTIHFDCTANNFRVYMGIGPNAGDFNYTGNDVSGVFIRNFSVTQNRAHTYRNLVSPGTRDLIQATLVKQWSHRMSTDLVLPVMPHGVADGNNSDCMQGATAADWVAYHNGTGGYLWIVAQVNTSASASPNIIDSANATSANAGILCWWDSAGTRISLGIGRVGSYVHGAAAANSPASYPSGTWALIGIGLIDDGSAEEVWYRVNRAYIAGFPQAITNAPSAANPPGPMTVFGSSVGLGGTLRGKFAEAVGYARGTRMTQAEIDYVEKILWNRWAPLTGWTPI